MPIRTFAEANSQAATVRFVGYRGVVTLCHKRPIGLYEHESLIGNEADALLSTFSLNDECQLCGILSEVCSRRCVPSV